MSKFTIVANGEIFSPSIALPFDEKIIAADGGARHCLALGLSPQIVIGDFDSLSDAEVDQLQANGAKFIRHPADKDETDLELALDQALKLGATEVTLYGLLGGRWDMSIANLLLLAAPRFAGIRFHLRAGDTEAFILRGGQTLELRGQPGTTVSVIPLSAKVSGLSYDGLQWPLEEANLPFGSPRGVSNLLIQENATIRVAKGVLLVFLIKKLEVL